MRIVHAYSLLLVLLVSGFHVEWASAQSYPTKTIRILTGNVGAGSDLMARTIAPELSAALGQPVVVENQSAGLVLAASGMQAAPDGHTLMVNISGLWIAPLLQQVNYDPIRDFAPIAMLGRVTSVLVVHPSLPVNSVADLIKLAKAKPGELNIVVGPTGGSAQIAAELFKSMANINVVSIPYKGGPEVDVLAGRVHMSINGIGSWAGHIKAGKVRGLATTGAQRSALLPDLPTIGETLPGYVAEGLNALFAPAKTPDAIIVRLNQETNRVLAKPEVRQRLLNAGTEPVGGPPEQLTNTIKAEVARLDKLIKSGGLKTDK